jgi:MtaA/CmuA family methyltransferase
MNSKELVAAVLRGKPASRVPAGPLAVHFCARYADASLLDYSRSATVLADSVIRYYERFGPDAVWLSTDTWVSAEAMGAKVAAPGPHQPMGGTGEPLVQCAADIDRIPPVDVGSQGRYPLMLEALSRVVAALGKDVFIVACFDQFPFSLASALMGLDTVMVKVLDDPELVLALMHRCEEYAAAYAMALQAVGADMLSGGDSPAGLLGPELYRRFAWPSESRLIERLRRTTPVPVSLHICGRAQPLLPWMKSTGADVLEVDQAVDLGEACRIVGPDQALWGNIDPVRVLAQGTPADAVRAAKEAIRAVRTAGHHRFVLSSGCTLAVETPPENLEAFLGAAREV